MMISPQELLSEFPSSYMHKEFVRNSRNTLKEIIEGKKDLLVLIVGPCSIHDEYSTYEYADRLARLSEEVSDKFFIIMRTYFEKPRTKKGWKGLLNDPTLDGRHDIRYGLRLTRKILLSLAERNIASGCEILELVTHQYYSDLLTWGCVGARTSSSQPHRQLASSFSFPIGFKNSTDGNIDGAINGIVSAKAAHTFLCTNCDGKIDEIRTRGNPYCHLVLRGGDQGPNYERDCFDEALQKCENENIWKKILVDCSHGNSAKNTHGQMQVFRAMIDEFQRGRNGILGMMLESHLEEGSQSMHHPIRYGISVTDPCLGWEATRTTILEGAYQISALT